MTSDLILVDRSRSVTDWSCGRKRYFNYEYDEKGLTPLDAAEALAMGIIIHDSLAQIAREHLEHPDAVDIDTIASRAQIDAYNFFMKNESPLNSDWESKHTDASEQSARIEGILRGFYQYLWPIMMKQYPKILAIEQEMPYTYHSILYMTKPDLVVVNTEGEVVYIEYKSTSNNSAEWISSWDTAIQVHSTTRAIEHALGEKISHVVVQGLFKGTESWGKQGSPFCYAYKRSGTPPFSQDSTIYEYKPGYKRFPVWEIPGGVKEWVANMPETVLRDQFPRTPAIFVNDDQVEQFFDQRNVREQEIRMAMEMLRNESDEGVRRAILNTSFPQKFDQCSPSYRKGQTCPYKMLCFGDIQSPLTSGFVYRTPHHAIELEGQHEDICI